MTDTPVQTKRQELANMRFDEALDYYTPQLADALPDHIPLNRFKRVVITAVNTNPELARADRLSLFNSCVKCALDGLVPDGREAALVVYETSVKSINERGMDQWRKADIVQYMPMVAGIRKRMRNSGEVLSATAELVHRNDKFHYRQGDDSAIVHEQPPLDQDRGEMVGAYSIIKLKNGETLYEVMRASEIEHIMRTYAKGYDKPRSPWQRIPGEMWRKTVLRRNSKGAPSDSKLDRLLGRDDEPLEIPDARDLPAIPPRPVRSLDLAYDFESAKTEEDALQNIAAAPQQTWTVTLPEGELWEYDDPHDAISKLISAIEVAPDRPSIDALWEDNADLIENQIAPDATAIVRNVCGARIKELAKPTPEEKRAIPRRRGPQASEATAPPPTPPEPEKAPTAAAESLQDALAPQHDGDPSGRPFSVRIGAIRDPNLPPDRPQARIEVPNDPRGKPDYRAWALVKFMPVARRATSEAELAQLMGDYAEDIEAYKLTLTPMYRKAFEYDITALFTKLR